MLQLFINIDYLKLSEVARILQLKDTRSAKKWLSSNSLQISKIGSSLVVSRFAFEFKRQQLLVEELIKGYPNKWFDIYDANTTNKAIVKSIRALYPAKTSHRITKKNNQNNNYII